MTPRIEFGQLPEAAVGALMALEKYLATCSLDRSLLELVKLRASQLNGCAYCIDMHHKNARAAGENEQRLYALPAWRETPFYSERERAALAWTESVTELGADRVGDEVFALASAHFDVEELADLTFAVVAINGWNRLSVAFRPTPGSYRVGQFDH